MKIHKTTITSEHLERAIEERNTLLERRPVVTKSHLNCHCVVALEIFDYFGVPVFAIEFNYAILQDGTRLEWENDTYFLMKQFDAAHFSSAEQKLPLEFILNELISDEEREHFDESHHDMVTDFLMLKG
jgi:hypothetical protein